MCIRDRLGTPVSAHELDPAPRVVPGDRSQETEEPRIERVVLTGHAIGDERVEDLLRGRLRVEHKPLARVHLSERRQERGVFQGVDGSALLRRQTRRTQDTRFRPRARHGHRDDREGREEYGGGPGQQAHPQDIAHGPGPVSYTHLDVYKRQTGGLPPEQATKRAHAIANPAARRKVSELIVSISPRSKVPSRAPSICLLYTSYLAFRFDLRFAPGVIVACVHDAMVVIGVFVLLRKEVTLSTIAAVLTVVGYSMNDTVVVYDRIRENLGKHRGKSFAEIINLSVSETLSRTLLTSGATLLTIVAFFFYGTGVIKDFMFALLIGIIAGTYSSIYVAAPLTEWIDKRMSSKADDKKRLRGGGTGDDKKLRTQDGPSFISSR